MEEIYSYYKENIDAYTRRLGNLKKKIHLMGSIRLALVVGAILSLWIFRDDISEGDPRQPLPTLIPEYP